VKKWLAKTNNARRKIRDFLEERGLESANHAQFSRLHRFALFWLLRPHGGLRWPDVWLCVILPLGYFVYALARGAADGWYPYAFMDIGQFGAGVVAVNCAIMGAAFVVMASLLKLLDARLP